MKKIGILLLVLMMHSVGVLAVEEEANEYNRRQIILDQFLPNNAIERSAEFKAKLIFLLFNQMTFVEWDYLMANYHRLGALDWISFPEFPNW